MINSTNFCVNRSFLKVGVKKRILLFRKESRTRSVMIPMSRDDSYHKTEFDIIVNGFK